MFSSIKGDFSMKARPQSCEGIVILLPMEPQHLDQRSKNHARYNPLSGTSCDLFGVVQNREAFIADCRIYDGWLSGLRRNLSDWTRLKNIHEYFSIIESSSSELT